MLTAVSSRLRALDGRTANNYVVAQHTLRGTPVGRLSGMHGVSPAWFTVVCCFDGGEGGPEITHFTTGGTALLPHHGFYIVPPMNYVSLANTGSAQGIDGMTVQIMVQGNDYGTNDLTEQIKEQLAPATAEEFRRYLSSMVM